VAVAALIIVALRLLAQEARAAAEMAQGLMQLQELLTLDRAAVGLDTVVDSKLEATAVQALS